MPLEVSTIVEKTAPSPEVPQVGLWSVVASRITGAPTVMLALVVGAGGATLATQGADPKVAELETRVIAAEVDVRELGRKVDDDDTGVRLAALESWRDESLKADRARDELLSRLVYANGVQLRYSRWVGEQLQTIGRKVGAPLDDIPSEILEGLTGVALNEVRAGVHGVVSGP